MDGVKILNVHPPCTDNFEATIIGYHENWKICFIVMALSGTMAMCAKLYLLYSGVNGKREKAFNMWLK